MTEQTTNYEKKLLAVRAEQRKYAKHRMSLLEKVDQYREERDKLGPALERAIRVVSAVLPLPKGVYTLEGCPEKKMEPLDELQCQVANSFLRVEEQENEITAQIQSPILNCEKTEMELADAFRHSCALLGQAVDHGYRCNVDAMTDGLSSLAIRRAPDAASCSTCSGGQAGESIAHDSSFNDLLSSYSNTLDVLRQQLAQLVHRTNWLSHMITGNYETALTCYPDLIKFEESWRVLVSFSVSGSGHVSIYEVFDDVFSVGIRWASSENAGRYLRRLFRLGNNFLLVDRRVSYRQVASTISAVMRKGNNKDPFEIRDIDTKYQLTMDKDPIIVGDCANSAQPNFLDLAAKINPELARKRGFVLGSRRAPPTTKGRRTDESTDNEWTNMLKRVKYRWSMIKPFVSPAAIVSPGSGDWPKAEPDPDILAHLIQQLQND